MTAPRPAPCLERFHALTRSDPARNAVMVGTRRVTRADLLALSNDLAGQLAGGGLEPGGFAVLTLHNSLALAALPLAVWSLGAVPVMVPPEAPGDHLDAALATARAAVLVRGEEAADSTRITVEPGPGDPTGAPHSPELPDGPAGSVLFTSGSSGRPKGVVQTHATLLDCSDTLSRVIGYSTADSLLAAVPWTHDYGWTQLLAMYLSGVPLILPENRTAAALCTALDTHGPTVFGGVPSLFGLLTHGISNIRKVRRDSVRLLMSTGSHMPAEVAEALAGLFPGAGLRQNFGLTETFRTASLDPADRAARPGSSGRALPGVTIRILAPDGMDAAPRQEGEIVHCGPGTFAGYLDDPALSERVRRLPDGGTGVRTGDLGHLDADGYLFVTGRSDRQVKSMGLRLHLDDVERHLLAVPGIRQAAAIAKPHPITGSQVAAAIVLEDGAANPARAVRDLLPAHMRPRPLKAMEALPRRPNGKVDYPLLQEML